MKKDDCIFCKIANGEIPSRTLYEDEEFKVIMDLAPVTKGHSLIIPKNHFDNLYQMPDETLGKAVILAKKMATMMTDKLSCNGFNILQNNGERAGQTIFHFHMHLIPRYLDDNQKEAAFDATHPDAEELDAVLNRLQNSNLIRKVK